VLVALAAAPARARIIILPVAGKPSRGGLFVDLVLWKIGLALASPQDHRAWTIREWPHDHEPSPSDFEVANPWASASLSLGAAVLRRMGRDDVAKEWEIRVVANG
jgi:hypothetical protein